MDAQTKSGARLATHAIERHTQLLIETLDASLVHISPECVHWSAVCDPRRWLAPAFASFDWHREPIRHAIFNLASQYTATSDDLERFIQSGSAGHECDSKAILRDDLLAITRELINLLEQWISEPNVTSEDRPHISSPFPQYVPRVVPKALGDAMFTRQITFSLR